MTAQRAACESPVRCDQCGGVCCAHCPNVPAFYQFTPHDPATGRNELVIVCSLCVQAFTLSVLEAKQAAQGSRMPAPAGKQ